MANSNEIKRLILEMKTKKEFKREKYYLSSNSLSISGGSTTATQPDPQECDFVAQSSMTEILCLKLATKEI